MATEAKDISRIKANEIDMLSINTIRTLAMDAVQQAKSGHPGTPMALAPVTYCLWTRMQVERRHLQADVEDAHLYQRLAGLLIYSHPVLRPRPHILQLNEKTQSALWVYGISGDLPILVVRIADARDLPLVRQALLAHEYLRAKRFAFDLVILNDHPPSYAQSLQEALLDLVRTSNHLPSLDKPGGVFFGRLIQAALSRQREFLADASSVQFTRNPAGLSGALQKIGGVGSQVESPHAGEASHMFFGNGLSKPFLGVLATHPPLDERIRAIDPGWDGKFKQGGVKAVEAESPRGAAKPPSSRFPFPPIPGMPDARAGAAGIAANVVQVGAVLPNLGKPTPLHLRYAEDLRNSFSGKVQSAAREPLDATALLYAMLLSPDEALRAKQLMELARRTAPGVCDTTAALWPEVAPIASRARLPLVNLALPALRQLRHDEFEQFSQALQWLIESDDQIEIFEFVLQKIVRRHLASQSGETRPTSVQYHTLKPLVRDCDVVLSALAQADVGIAIGAGSDVAVETADVILVRSNLLDVVAIVQLSRATYRKMMQNLLWATGYNVVALPLAAGALYAWGLLLTPALGAVLMSASTDQRATAETEEITKC